jgi:hypothetical protein
MDCLSLEEFCSSQRFIEEFEIGSSGSGSSDSVSMETDYNSADEVTVTLDNNFSYFENGYYKYDDIYFNLKSKDLFRNGFIYSFCRKNLNSVYYKCAYESCFASITICDHKKTIVRESSIKEHTHSKLEQFEFEIAKSIGSLKYQVYNTILSIPQIYENVRADLAKVVAANVIAVKFPSYKSINCITLEAKIDRSCQHPLMT